MPLNPLPGQNLALPKNKLEFWRPHLKIFPVEITGSYSRYNIYVHYLYGDYGEYLAPPPEILVSSVSDPCSVDFLINEVSKSVILDGEEWQLFDVWVYQRERLVPFQVNTSESTLDQFRMNLEDTYTLKYNYLGVEGYQFVKKPK